MRFKLIFILAVILAITIANGVPASTSSQQSSSGEASAVDPSQQTLLDLDLPQPRMILLGQTGVGKTTLANVLSGNNDRRKGTCQGADSSALQSCTKFTTYSREKWLGTGPNFTVIDTPGFGDSRGPEVSDKLLEEMMQVLNEEVTGANAIMLLIKGTEDRFNQAIQDSLSLMEAVFGRHFWKNTILAFTFYSHDQTSKMDRQEKLDENREANGITDDTRTPEEVKLGHWNNELRKAFHLDQDLPGVFIDPMSQIRGSAKRDLGQQDIFRVETKKLWDFATSKDLFEFRTVTDVLKLNEVLTKENEKLEREKRDLHVENERLINDITSQLADAKKEIADKSQLFTSQLADAKTNITDLKTELDQNMIDLKNELNQVVVSKVNDLKIGTTKNLNDLKIGMTKNLNDLNIGMTKNWKNLEIEMGKVTTKQDQDKKQLMQVTTDLEEFNQKMSTEREHDKLELDAVKVDVTSAKNELKKEITDLDSMKLLPIGSIVAWVEKPTKTSRAPVSTIPKCWVKCDGSTIPRDSEHWQGELTPNLNGERRFLRGSPPSDVGEIQEDSLQEHFHYTYESGHNHGHNRLQGEVLDANKGRGFHFYGGEGSSRWHMVAYPTISGTTYTSKTNLEVKGVKNAKKSSETRPKNMAVTWIMKIC